MDLPQAGDRIRLIEMPHDPCPIEPGAEGTVTEVTVLSTPIPSSYSEWGPDGRPIRTQLPAPAITAQIVVAWDNGRSLFLNVPGDRFEVVTYPKCDNGEECDGALGGGKVYDAAWLVDVIAAPHRMKSRFCESCAKRLVGGLLEVVTPPESITIIRMEQP